MATPRLQRAAVDDTRQLPGASKFSLKIRAPNSVRRIALPATASFGDMLAALERLCLDGVHRPGTVPSGMPSVQFVDDQGDLCSITCTQEWREATRLSGADTGALLTLIVGPAAGSGRPQLTVARRGSCAPAGPTPSEQGIQVRAVTHFIVMPKDASRWGSALLAAATFCAGVAKRMTAAGYVVQVPRSRHLAPRRLAAWVRCDGLGGAVRCVRSSARPHASITPTRTTCTNADAADRDQPVRRIPRPLLHSDGRGRHQAHRGRSPVTPRAAPRGCLEAPLSVRPA